MACSTSSTTIPVPTSCSYSLNSPPWLSPRQTLNFRLATVNASVQFFERGVGNLRQFQRRWWTHDFFDKHIPCRTFLNNDIVFDTLFALAFMVQARVSTAAFLAHVCSARDGFAGD